MSKKIQGKEVINKLFEGEIVQEAQNKFLFRISNEVDIQYRRPENYKWEPTYAGLGVFLQSEFIIYPSIEKRINEILKRNYLKVVEVKHNSLKVTFNSIGEQDTFDILEFVGAGFRVKESCNHYGGGASFQYSKSIINELIDLFVTSNFNFLEWKDTI